MLIINKENTHDIPVNINVHRINLDVVKDYSYLGHIITSDGKGENK
jgi:hypothetical protein